MKNKILAILFIIIIFGLGILSIILKDNEISSFERRKLANFPKLDENFTNNLEDYLLDQFPFRNKLINLKSIINRKVLNNLENNNVYVVEDNIFEKNYPLDENKTLKFTQKLNSIIENKEDKTNIYYSIIPDKSYFLDEEKYLKLDYKKMYEIVQNNLNANYIDITNSLKLEDYYKIDIHWKQENIKKVAEQILTGLGKDYKEKEYIKKSYNDFYGASYSKAGLDLKPDTLKYLYHKEFENIDITHLEYGKKDIYDEEKLTNLDSYDVFLSGASSFIEIKNNNLQDNSSLIIFRDSFASSLIPLLLPYYNEVTVVDLRYIDYSIVKEKIDLNNSDILFLYSTLIINSSDIIKVGADDSVRPFLKVTTLNK